MIDDNLISGVSLELAKNFLEFIIDNLFPEENQNVKAAIVDATLLHILESNIDISRATEIELQRIAINFFEGSRRDLKRLIFIMRLKISSMNVYPLTYSNGHVMSSKSIVYSLAQLLISDSELSLTRLNLVQQKFLRIFIEELGETGKFISYAETARRIRLSVGDIYNNIETIISKLITQIYILGADKHLHPIDPNTALGKLFKLYEENNNLLDHPDLTLGQKLSLEALFNSEISDGVYKSFNEATKNLNIDRNNWYAMIQDAYERLTNENNFFDKLGWRIGKNEARRKLLDLYLQPTFRAAMTPDELRLIDLLMERNGNRFTYSYEDIAVEMQIKGKNPEQTVKTRIYRIMSKLEAPYYKKKQQVPVELASNIMLTSNDFTHLTSEEVSEPDEQIGLENPVEEFEATYGKVDPKIAEYEREEERAEIVEYKMEEPEPLYRSEQLALIKIMENHVIKSSHLSTLTMDEVSIIVTLVLKTPNGEYITYEQAAETYKVTLEFVVETIQKALSTLNALEL